MGFKVVTHGRRSLKLGTRRFFASLTARPA
jgi:hypothetical protein